MKVKTELNVYEYMNMVNDIAIDYFDDAGNYAPHIGMLNAMRLFYNFCVVESKFDDTIPHKIVNAFDLNDIVADAEFIEEFNKAVLGDGTMCLDFSNAYADALEIVDVKKSSIGNMAMIIQKALESILDKTSSVLTDDNLAALQRIGDSIAKGDLSAEAIVREYAKSERYQDLLNSPKEK